MRSPLGAEDVAHPPLAVIGRDAEHDAAAHAIAEIATAGAGGVLIRGEAGIGKSRLLADLSDHCDRQGWRVLSARAGEFESHLPYAVLHQIALNARAGADPEIVDLCEQLMASLDLAAGEPAAAVQSAAVELLSAVRSRQRTVIVIDDLHLMDSDTAAVLGVLIRRRDVFPLLLLGAIRLPWPDSVGALATLIGRLTRDGALRTIDLGPISHDSIRLMIEQMLARPAAAAVVDAVAGHSGGNPFFIEQMVLGLGERVSSFDEPVGAAIVPANAWTLPRDRQALLVQLFDLDEAALRFVRACAFLGPVPRTRIELCARLVGIGDDEAARAGDDLVARGVLILGPNGAYAFSHQLVRDTFFSLIGAGERWMWHRQSVAWLSQLPQTPAVILELAAHVREASEPGDESAITTLTRAAELQATTAPRSAVAWYEAALAFAPSEHPARIDLAIRMTRAQLLAGQPRLAAATGRSVLADITTDADRDRTVSLVLEALYESASTDEALQFVEEQQDSRRRSLRTQAYYAMLLAGAGRSEPARTVAAEIERRSQPIEDGEMVVIMVLLTLTRMFLGEFDQVQHLLNRLESSARYAPRAAQASAQCTTALVYSLMGDTEAADSAIFKARDLLGESPPTLLLGYLAASEANHAFSLGSWDTPLTLFNDLAADFEEAGFSSPIAALVSVVLEVLANRGEGAEVRRIITHAVTRYPLYEAAYDLSAGRVALLAGNTDDARTVLRSRADHASTPKSDRVRLRVRLAEVEIAAGDFPAARAVLDQIGPIHRGDVRHDTFIEQRCVLGAITQDVAPMLEALEVAEQYGLVFFEARIRLRLAEHDHAAGPNLLSAHETFRRLRAEPWRRRVVAELRRRGQPIPRQRRLDGALLTQTEDQISLLIQDGRSNREIATALNLSIKTVGTYLSRIYAKTGCSSRLELARALDAGTVRS